MEDGREWLMWTSMIAALHAPVVSENLKILTPYVYVSKGMMHPGTMSCTSIEYSVSGIAYSSVCGKVIAYHAGWKSRSFCTFDCPPRFPDHRLSVAILIVVHVT